MPPPAGYTSSQLIAEDQFNGSTLNSNFWNNCMGDYHGCWQYNGLLPSPYSGENGGSYQIQYEDPYSAGYGTNTTGNHLVVGNGALNVIATPSNKFSNLGYSWASAGIASFGKVSLPATGGYVQFHAKMPDSRYGGWGGLWFMPSANSDGAEFDLQESGTYGTTGSATANRVLASHWWGGSATQKISDTGIDLSAGYHTYGLEYIPGQAWKVYLDGKLMYTWTDSVSKNASYELIIEQEIAGSKTTGWHTVADPVNHPGPNTLSVDDVQVYSLSSNTGTTPTPTPTPVPSTTDTSAPTVPANVTATAVSSSQVSVSWSPSTDNVGVYGYDIYRNGAYLGFSATPSYTDTTVAAGVTYSYQVLAYDAAHNASALSSAATVTVGASTNTSALTVTVPANNATVSGSVLVSGKTGSQWVNVAVYDASGNKIGLDAMPVNGTYSTVVNTAGLSNGTQTWTVTAFSVSAGQSGGTSASVPVTVNVQNNVTPVAFGIGTHVVTTDALNVRNKSNIHSGKVLCTQPVGSAGVITGGPQYNQGYTWWYINYGTGCDGWSVQDYLTATVAIVNTLGRGSAGPQVTALQTILSELGLFKGETTGYFGSLTESAVQALQTETNLASVGIVGPQTRALLSELGI